LTVGEFERLGGKPWTQCFRIRVALLANKLYAQLVGAHTRGDTLALERMALRSPPQPRTRGEHMTWLFPSALILASAPHARGTQRPQERRRALQPRTRGEHTGHTGYVDVNCASAPHARGTRSHHEVEPVRHRFSPARAGNTYDRTTPRSICTLQPRTRGEHL
jgi:hypothetical protein